jgi:hypothetical protein
MKFSLCLLAIAAGSVGATHRSMNHEKFDLVSRLVRLEDQQTVHEIWNVVVKMIEVDRGLGYRVPATYKPVGIIHRDGRKKNMQQKRSDRQIFVSLVKGLLYYSYTYFKRKPLILCILGLMGFQVAMLKSEHLRLFMAFIYIKFLDRITLEVNQLE